MPDPHQLSRAGCGEQADEGNHALRAVNLASGETRTLAGSGNAGFSNGVREAAGLYLPWGVAVHPDGQRAFWSDRLANTLRQIDLASHYTSTLAGLGDITYPGF
eukprot:81018-Rhodomonas_salina.1